MPRKKKPFINKKTAVTFQVLHRSQKDPLQVDEDAPQRVLVPLEEKDQRKHKEEQLALGIYFNDNYDYLQHIKSTDEATSNDTEIVRIEANPKVKRLNLPVVVLPSQTEEAVGMLNLAAPISGPQIGMDPDILAALDDDYDCEDELEDDFVALANSHSAVGTEDVGRDMLHEYLGSQHQFEDAEDDDDEEYEDVEDGDSDDEMDDGHEDGDLSDGESAVGGRFTQYSLSSSVVPRSENLKLLDDRFEQFYEQYLDDEIGDLQQDDIEGHLKVTSEMLKQIAEEYHRQKKQPTLKEVVQKLPEDQLVGSSSSAEELETVDEPLEAKWDCESILSTYSTLYNHPTIINSERSTNPRPQRKKKTSEQSESDSRVSQSEEDKVILQRRKNETPEEKKLRKQGVKEMKKMRREIKKKNRELFRSEELKQKRDLQNVQQNLAGIRLS